MFEQNFKEIVEIIKSEFFLTKEKKQEVINNCIQKVKEKVEKDNLKSLVMGISGGLDSAVVAAICQEKNTGVPLITFTYHVTTLFNIFNLPFVS